MTVRNVQFARVARETLEGAGVRVRRAFGSGDEREFDPFLMFDDFRAEDPAHYRLGFPWHPHRGIETITYMIAGECEHGDSMGNQGIIRAGDVQWMTAGSGVIHQEMPRGDESGRMGGFQLWLNLPSRLKMMDPRYRGITAAEIPEVEDQGAHIRVICGSVGGSDGPVADVEAKPEYFDVTLAAGAGWSHVIERGRTAFAYLFQGSARFSEPGEFLPAGTGTAVLFADGDEMAGTAGPEGARFLLATGPPLREPIAWRGPIVMNYSSELDEAWRELRTGTFVRTGAVPTPR